MNPTENARALELLQRLPGMLHHLDAHETQSALQSCLLYAFNETKPLAAPLRRSTHPATAAMVIKHYIECDCDEGTLQVLRERMLEPGVQATRRTGAQLLRDMGSSLGWWCDPQKAPDNRSRAIALVLQILQQSLAAADAAERLKLGADGWFYTERLIDAISDKDVDSAPAVL